MTLTIALPLQSRYGGDAPHQIAFQNAHDPRAASRVPLSQQQSSSVRLKTINKYPTASRPFMSPVSDARPFRTEQRRGAAGFNTAAELAPYRPHRPPATSHHRDSPVNRDRQHRYGRNPTKRVSDDARAADNATPEGTYTYGARGTSLPSDPVQSSENMSPQRSRRASQPASSGPPNQRLPSQDSSGNIRRNFTNPFEMGNIAEESDCATAWEDSKSQVPNSGFFDEQRARLPNQQQQNINQSGYRSGPYLAGNQPKEAAFVPAVNAGSAWQERGSQLYNKPKFSLWVGYLSEDITRHDLSQEFNGLRGLTKVSSIMKSQQYPDSESYAYLK